MANKSAQEIENERQAALKTAAKDKGENVGTGVTPPAPGSGPQNTEEARKQSLETLKTQETNRPYPSQEEADEMRARRSGVKYNNRAAESK